MIIIDDISYDALTRSFYNNKECNSESEYFNDLQLISFIDTLCKRHDTDDDTNYGLLFNHFISLLNCFGIIAENMLVYKLPHHIKKINSLFILVGQKHFDGTIEIDESFFIRVKRSIMPGSFL